jgi:SAM-dependent methyltransferase
MIDYLKVKSVLDLGSGTGRALLPLKAHKSELTVLGIEPSQELREQGYLKGLSREELISGDAQRLLYPDNSFDLVCEFGALHHILAEMLRCARKAIFISDCYNFGRGARSVRYVKQAINALALWQVANFIKTLGKGYTISDGDGLAYSYSVL